MLRRADLLRVCEDVALVLGPDGNDQVLHRGQVVPLSRPHLDALEIFAVRRSLESGVRALQRRGVSAGGAAGALSAVVELVDRGLVAKDHDGSILARPIRRGMLGAPLVSLGDVSERDIVFYGVPYEAGVTGRGGTAGGPDYLRRSSATAFDYSIPPDPGGWWHPELEDRVLGGVRLMDIGDVECRPRERNGAAFDRARIVQAALLDRGAFPVVLGGDHSISLALIEATAERYPGLGVIHFDAHADLGSQREMGPWRLNASHGNFMSWVVAHAGVAEIVQIGIRHLLQQPPPLSPKVRTYHPSQVVEHLDEIVDSLDPSRPWYLTFDVDCLDPSLIRQTGTPVPGGLNQNTARRALQRIAGAVDLVAADFVELCPGRDLIEGTVVSYLVFEALAYRDHRLRSGAISADQIHVW